MRLASFAPPGGAARLGVLVTADGPDAVVDVRRVDPRLPADVPAVLAGGPVVLDQLRRAVGAAGEDARHRVADVELLAPVPRPGKIVAVGLNYRDHAEETGDAIPEAPVVFAKFPSSVTGPYADIVHPADSTRLDYEGELGVVIGRRCRHVEEADAPGVIGGYLVLDDVSARDVQNRNSQWTLGKSYDTFAPIGPAVVTPDEVGDPQALDISTHVNEEPRQKSNTRNMIFGVYELVSRISAVCTLEPGDIIATGTPGGVGIGFDPERLLAVGDVVRVTVQGIGTIANRVTAASA
ncbi:MAG TPA: fumarylacetoacetate hydrolase family protein [Mycobacteriales bacterium]|jgi:2-keto-4-pentenoate hydratase/2-oxohepta-3-ene-1,7-dioic acid hydratase in catechol pathway|nr:fumarylacetoacetate hydrolase family protein [Mycobacteriales bacterium]